MPHIRSFLFVTGCVALFFTLPTVAGAGTPEKVTYRLKWLINMSTVGDVMAERDGYFKHEGLEVKIKSGGPERDAIRELELGYADFGVASADQVIQAVAKGAPIVVIAQLFQVNPLRWIYFTDQTHINGLQDLKGKRIGVTFGKNDEFIMRSMLSKGSITEDQVRLFSVRLDYTPFFKRKVALWPVYANTQAIEIGEKLTAAGEAFGLLNPRDYGIRFVANSVVTSTRMMADHPDVVNRFLKALLMGWQAAIDAANTEAALAAVRQYDRDTSSALLLEQLKATSLLVAPENGNPVGSIDVPAWKQTEAIMITYRQIGRPVNIEKNLISNAIQKK